MISRRKLITAIGAALGTPMLPHTLPARTCSDLLLHTQNDAIRIIKEVELFAVSIVTHPEPQCAIGFKVLECEWRYPEWSQHAHT